MDLDQISEVRQTWQFYRDRRPDAYEDLVQALSVDATRARRTMDFGFTLKPEHSIERTVALTRQAEAAGFSYGWLFDSHVLWRDPYPLLTLMAQATDRLRLGTCVTNPARASRA